MNIPKKVAIYYEAPINLSNNIQNIINILSVYDILILGEGLANPSHQDYTSTSNIINSLLQQNVCVYGYVSLAKLSSTNNINDWDNVNVTGIFGDEFGDDYGNTRDDQNSFLDYIHSKNMNCMINAPISVFDNYINPLNPNGDSLNYQSDDWYVFMGFGVNDSVYNNPISSASIINNYSIKVCCIGTSNGISNKDLIDYSYYICVLMEFDAWGWGEYRFRGSLPYRDRKDVIGDKFATLMNDDGGIYSRRRNVGISIDSNTKKVCFKIKV